jgi:glutaconyl-CoA/methylmalonyl-CoA decarboxylase subunit gamma
MKKLRITVDGKAYDVTVQVLEDDEREMDAGSFLSPLPPAPRPARPAPLPPPGSPLPKGDPNAIFAPLAGTVQKVFVSAGTRVDAKAPVVLLDAMKMDTYIYAPRGGEVAAVEVAPGDSVQVGDCLIRYRPEA